MRQRPTRLLVRWALGVWDAVACVTPTVVDGQGVGPAPSPVQPRARFSAHARLEFHWKLPAVGPSALMALPLSPLPQGHRGRGETQVLIPVSCLSFPMALRGAG